MQAPSRCSFFPNCEITAHKTWLFMRINRMENCFSSPSAFKRWFVFHMDTCAGLLLWLNYRCAIWKATGGGGLDVSRCFFVVAYQKPTRKEGIFASYVSQIPACIIWSQTTPTKPTHSMLLTAHFILIYILKRPPTRPVSASSERWSNCFNQVHACSNSAFQF